jgi:hypothetical protein
VHISVSDMLYNSETIITPTPEIRQMFHAIKQKNVQKQKKINAKLLQSVH